ncbi:MAG TPA: hypothetical protein PKC59_01150 [Burkholderiaceae bacterium]|nr:hypothetical protein [Burkholderiaceae bacterium]HMX11333.1 hypothetical protein [Burkholderiaceae bacterium]HMY98995.1 hypothetical protein [Burkholderiaceae bacterium]HNB45804.1 hypothetical protein [Burkholderiaceae bacterium]HNG78767.1 hypothetical protein [Burkholderiaceae bacterium]
MDRRAALQVALCAGLSFVIDAAALAETKARAAGVRLPAASKDVILRWDSRGGLRVAGDIDQPALLVHADGSFSARGAALGGARRTGQLTRRELRELLDEVVIRQQFGSIRTADIDAGIRRVTAARQEQRVRPMDGATTHIQVTLPQLVHSVEWADLHADRDAFPEVEPLQRLFAIQQRLLALAKSAR